jgi:Actin-like ATPase involved in cell morphogenesis
VLNEPTVIALNSHTHDVLAMGQEAWHMIGRTPGYIVPCAAAPGRDHRLRDHPADDPSAAATAGSRGSNGRAC